MNKAVMAERLRGVFPAEQAEVLAGVIYDAYNALVKADDFNELKEIVRRLAEAQERTDQRVAELAVAQQQTEQRLAKLTMVVQGLAVELGGLSRAVSYALENEAYRGLPRLLKERLGLEAVGRLMRREVEGEEINIFGEARRGDEVVLVVGEAKLQLDRGRSRASKRARVFAQLRRKVEAVRRAYPGREVVAILVTHYARPVFIEEAKAQGVEVFQSYEW
jgi:predicted transcriptional regulator